jgi:hypothetical protein
MRLRLALATLGAAVATVMTTMVIVPLAADHSGPTTSPTPYASTSVSGTNYRADGAVDDGVDDVVARAYGGCRIWSENAWPRRAASVRDNGKEYRSHGNVWSATKVGYAYNVYSDEEIRGDGTLGEVQIIRQTPRLDAPVSESTFFLQYRPAAAADMRRHNLDGGKCRNTA